MFQILYLVNIYYIISHNPHNILERYFFKDFIHLFFRERGREGERERNINVWLPLACPLLGTWPTTQAYALTGNRLNPRHLGEQAALNPLSHTSQGDR